MKETKELLEKNAELLEFNLKPTYASKLLQDIRTSVKDFKIIDSNYTASGIEAVGELGYDQQKYKITITPVRE